MNDPGTGKPASGKVDETTLASFYEEYYDRIARYAYIRIGNRSDAEDIAGEVFLRALRSLKSYKERGVPLQAWLFKIAHNLVVDYFRKMTKRRTVPLDDIEIEADSNPAKMAEDNIELERVAKVMKQLTKEQREVIGLRFFGGLTSKEVGDILHKSDGAVREMQRATIEKLRRLLAIGS